MTKALKARRNGGKGRGGFLPRQSEGSKQGPVPSQNSRVPHSREELLSISRHISNRYLAPEAQKTEVFLAEIDPHKVHASWSICRDDYDLARQSISTKTVGKEPVVSVRLYDVTTPKLSGAAQVAYTDVAVQGLSNNWYIDLKKPARSFVADIGLADSAGRFIRLATSNRIHTPPAGPSPMATYVQIETGKTPGMIPPEARILPPVVEEKRPAKPKKPSGENIRIDQYAWLPPQILGLSPEDARSRTEQVLPFMQEHGQEKRATEKTGAPAAKNGTADSSPKGEPGKDQRVEAPGAQQETSVSSPVGSSWMSGVGLGCSPDVQEVLVEVRISGRAAPNREITLYGKKVRTDAKGRFSVQAQVPADSWIMPLLMDQVLPDHGERGL